MLLKSKPGTNHTEFTFPYSMAENSFWGELCYRKNTEKNAACFYPFECLDPFICPRLKLLFISFKKTFCGLRKKSPVMNSFDN